ncbi:MAG: CDP-diacylglycerol--glycerol-3-phosphate 3-phosphatidyltransferase [Myxococcota bacterium]
MGSTRRRSRHRPRGARRARGEARTEERKRRRKEARARRQRSREQRKETRKTLWEDAKNLPNLLTFLRIVMIPVVLVLLERGRPVDCYWAAWVFVAAAVTDLIDGWLARRMGLVSVLGKFLDPLADKLIVAAVLVWLVQMGRIPAWITVILLSREITITALRGVASSEGLIISAGAGGKLKTALQMLGLICLIIGYRYRIDLGFYDFGLVDFVHVGRYTLYASMVFSLTSAASYMTLFADAIEQQGGQKE